MTWTNFVEFFNTYHPSEVYPFPNFECGTLNTIMYEPELPIDLRATNFRFFGKKWAFVMADSIVTMVILNLGLSILTKNFLDPGNIFLPVAALITQLMAWHESINYVDVAGFNTWLTQWLIWYEFRQITDQIMSPAQPQLAVKVLLNTLSWIQESQYFVGLTYLKQIQMAESAILFCLFLLLMDPTYQSAAVEAASSLQDLSGMPMGMGLPGPIYSSLAFSAMAQLIDVVPGTLAEYPHLEEQYVCLHKWLVQFLVGAEDSEWPTATRALLKLTLPKLFAFLRSWQCDPGVARLCAEHKLPSIELMEKKAAALDLLP